MSKQVDFSQLTDDEKQEDASKDVSESDVSVARRTDKTGDGSSNIDTLVAPAVESWVRGREDHEENYGYFHLFVVAKSDLSGVERHLQYEEELDMRVSEDETSHHYGSRWGHGGVRANEVRDRLINWKLSELATPYHSDLRTVSATNLRVFVAEPARDLLSEQNIDIDTLVETLNQLDEHEPSDEQLATHREYIETREAVSGGSAPLKQRVRAIETTVRARFEFTGRYDGEVPDPHPDYCDLGPEALKRKLESARDDLAQTDQRKDDLYQEITDKKSQWIEERRTQLFV